jgi:hypothetical protein
VQHLEIGAGCSLTRNGFPVIQSGVSGGGVDTFQYSGGVSFNTPFERAPVVVATMLTRAQPFIPKNVFVVEIVETWPDRFAYFKRYQQISGAKTSTWLSAIAEEFMWIATAWPQ